MDEQKFQKSLKDAKLFAAGVMAIIIVLFVLTILSGEANAVVIVVRALQLGLIIATIIGLNKESKYGAICGILVSVLMIISRDIISLIFGILYLIDCVKILNYMNNNQ